MTTLQVFSHTDNNHAERSRSVAAVCVKRGIARVAFALAALMQCTAWAAWPEKPIRIIVPYVPGGNIDITARALAPGLSELLGQPILVDNRAGANGALGTELAAKSAADGYTLLLGSTGTLTNAPALYASLPYDPVKDFATVSMVSMVPIVMETHPAVPARSVAEFTALAKARRGTIAMAYGGTTSRLAGELFQSMTGTKLLLVPYKGSGAALIDLIGGHVDVFFDQLSSSIGYIRSGRLRALGVATPKRVPYLPVVPTISESGLPGFDASTVLGIVVPAATPRDIVSRIHAALTQVLGRRTIRDEFARFGAVTLESSPEAFASFIRDDIAKWTTLIRNAGIKPE